MSAVFESYTDIECPRCGYTEGRDQGPYESDWTDDALGGPPEPRVHCLWCGRCGKPFDIAMIDDECGTCGQPVPEWADGPMALTWLDAHVCVPPAFRRAPGDAA